MSVVVPSPTLKPADLGIKGFEAFRPAQIKALERIAESEARVLLVQAPTGSGKSLIARAAGALLKQRATYCSTTKQLQRQFCQSFPDAVELLGRSNYPTQNAPYPGVTCDDCDWTKAKGCSYCSDKACCPYNIQKRNALASPFAVLNTAYFLAEANHVGGFSDRSRFLVLDEADTLEKQVLETVAVRFSQQRLDEMRLRPQRLTDRPEDEDWRGWFEGAAEAAMRVAGNLRAEAEGLRDQGGEQYAAVSRKVRGWHRLLDQMGAMVEELGEDRSSWVRVDEPRGLCFKPVMVRRHAERGLWAHAGRFLLMSATMLAPDQFARDLGLEEGDYDWLELPSSFPAENRPIRYRPAGSMALKQRSATVPKAICALDGILDGCRDRVLVHTHTYDLARQVIASSRHGRRMVTYANAAEREQALGRFTSAEGADAVLVAPSMSRGVDLPDDMCRCVVVLVIPKPYYGDARVRVRLRKPDGWLWCQVEQIRELCQMTGRGVRHELDRCDTYILDAEFEKLWKASGKRLFPGWWREAVIAEDGHGG